MMLDPKKNQNITNSESQRQGLHGSENQTGEQNQAKKVQYEEDNLTDPSTIEQEEISHPSKEKSTKTPYVENVASIKDKNNPDFS